MLENFSPQRLIVSVVLLVITCLSGVAGATPKAGTYEAEYLLIDHLRGMTSNREKRRVPKTPRHILGFDERRVLLQHPPLFYRFPDVPSGPKARLVIAPVILPGAWEQATDGVAFEAACRTADGDWAQLLELSVSPATNPADRKWHDREIGLDRCSRPTTEIELRTSCGPRGDCTADWAGWAQPRVVYEQVLKPRFDQLVLLISIDTLRPDRLGLYGGSRQTSPELERLARDAIVFETAMATSPWTIPSHASMLTSTDPCVHGADAQKAIADHVPLLAEILGEKGWQTAGFVDSFYMGRKFGFQRGFQHFDDKGAPRGDYRRGGRLVRQRLFDWLTSAGDLPAFVFWHLMDVHGPYRASAPFGGKYRGAVKPPEVPDPRLQQLKDVGYHGYLEVDQFSSFEDLLAAYDEGIAEADSILGGLLQMLRATDLYDDALIIVTSDHGESFLDHGIWVGHGLFLTDDEIRVPLIVKLPDNQHAGTRVSGPVSLVDIAPTILDVLGVRRPESFQGRSLISPSPGESGSLRRVATGLSSNTGARFLRTESFKYISPATAVAKKIIKDVLKIGEGRTLPVTPLLREQLYDLSTDAQEAKSLARSSDRDGVVDQLKSFRAEFARQTRECGALKVEAQSEVPELDPEVKRQLEALGYVN